MISAGDLRMLTDSCRKTKAADVQSTSVAAELQRVKYDVRDAKEALVTTSSVQSTLHGIEKHFAANFC